MELREPSGVPAVRVRRLVDGGVRSDGAFVLYWMTTARRARWNYALDRAVELARALDRPLVVVESLRCDYPWASDRHHRFVLQGMADNARALSARGVHYQPYVEPRPGIGEGLLRALASESCAVVTDEWPASIPHCGLAAASGQVDVQLEALDSNGLLPVHATERVFRRAFDLRRFLQRSLRPHLEAPPRRDALARVHLRPLGALPAQVTRRWPRAAQVLLEGKPGCLGSFPIDHDVGATDLPGGSRAARRRLTSFLSRGLEAYVQGRNHPDAGATSGLSPYLHHGHVSPHEVLGAVARREDWSVERFGGEGHGARLGWWGTSEAAETFLDQLVTWRELGLNNAWRDEDFGLYESLPAWARTTLEEHAGDPRPHLYSRAEFEAGATHDALWNAAQRELRESGRMHNYLRMLWGKKILHWSREPRAALEDMVALNDRHALDGRDFNSYSGILWVLGRYDRAWGPERAVFGKVRYMSSENTRRKLRLHRYLERWGRPCVEGLPDAP